MEICKHIGKLKGSHNECQYTQHLLSAINGLLRVLYRVCIHFSLLLSVNQSILLFLDAI